MTAINPKRAGRVSTPPLNPNTTGPRTPSSAPAPTRLNVRDELSTGRGLRLRQASFRADGGVPPARAPDAQDLTDKMKEMTAELARLNELMTRTATAVATAYEQGGAQAAAAELRRQTEHLSPADAAAVVTGSQVVIDSIVADLGRTSGSADGGQREQGPDQVAFDQTLADLNVALSRGAETELGASAIARVTDAITQSIMQDGIGRWDEALGNTLVGGPYFDSKGDIDPSGLAAGDATLARAVIQELHDLGESGKAEDILRNVKDSLEGINTWSEKAEEQVAPLARELDSRLAALGPEATEAQRRAVIDAFNRAHPGFANLTASLETRMELVDQLFDLPRSLPGVNEGLRGLFDHTIAELVQGAMP